VSESFPPAAADSPQPPPVEPAGVPIHPPDGKVWVTYAILGVTIFVYLLQMLSELLLGGDYPAFLGMKVNEFILMGEVWRFLTPVLLHGSILHIAFNMLFLYRIGPGLEKNYGSGRFFALYLATAFTGNVFSFLFTKAPSLGASTAIFGLVTANAVLIYRNKNLFRNAQKVLKDLTITIVFNLVLGMSAGIDNFGHLGGLLGGLAISWFAGPILALRPEPDGYHIYDQQPASLFTIVVCVVVVVFSLLAVGKALLLF
jgi:rhomboid protease GluP